MRIKVDKNSDALSFRFVCFVIFVVNYELNHEEHEYREGTRLRG